MPGTFRETLLVDTSRGSFTVEARATVVGGDLTLQSRKIGNLQPGQTGSVVATNTGNLPVCVHYTFSKPVVGLTAEGDESFAAGATGDIKVFWAGGADGGGGDNLRTDLVVNVVSCAGGAEPAALRRTIPEIEVQLEGAK